MAGTGNADEKADRLASWILIAILVVPGLCLLFFGGLIYFTVVDGWAGSRGGFSGAEGAIGWLFGMGAAAAMATGLLLVGISFRLLRTRWAPLASLGLAVLSAGFVILTYYVFSDTNTSVDSIEIVFLQGSCIVLLLIVALPPFLHWAMAKPAATTAPTEPGR